MRKIAALVTAASLMLGVTAFASETDLSGMSFAELAQLKQEVEAEYNSRPEAEPFPVGEGYYLAVREFTPGGFFGAPVDPDDNG